jgi:hypothetical protein
MRTLVLPLLLLALPAAMAGRAFGANSCAEAVDPDSCGGLSHCAWSDQGCQERDLRHPAVEHPEDCSWGVDPTTGQYVEVCGGSGQAGGGCTWGVNPATGQYTEVCG